MRRTISFPRLRLGQNRGETGEDLVHDRLRDGFEVSGLPGRQIRDATLITANRSDGTGACIIKRFGEPAMAGELSAGGDSQDDRRPGSSPGRTVFDNWGGPSASSVADVGLGKHASLTKATVSDEALCHLERGRLDKHEAAHNGL